MLNFIKTEKLADALLGKNKKIDFLPPNPTKGDMENVSISAGLFRRGVSFYWPSAFLSDVDVAQSYYEAFSEELVDLPARVTNVVTRAPNGRVMYTTVYASDARKLIFSSYSVDAVMGRRVVRPVSYLAKIDDFNSERMAASVQSNRSGFFDNMGEHEAAMMSGRFLLSHLACLCALETEVHPKSGGQSELLWRDTPLNVHNLVKLPESCHGPSSGAEFGPRMAPRLHLRRGHLRRLPSGQKTWVRPCWVGHASQGVVSKEYEVA